MPLQSLIHTWVFCFLDMHVLFCCPRLRTAREDSAIEALMQIKGYYQRGMFNARICNIIEITPVIYERSITARIPFI